MIKFSAKEKGKRKEEKKKKTKHEGVKEMQDLEKSRAHLTSFLSILKKSVRGIGVRVLTSLINKVKPKSRLFLRP